MTHTEDTLTDDRARDTTDAVLAAYRDQNRWLVEGRTDRLDELLDDSYTAIHISGYQQRTRPSGWLRSTPAG